MPNRAMASENIKINFRRPTELMDIDYRSFFTEECSPELGFAMASFSHRITKLRSTGLTSPTDLFYGCFLREREADFASAFGFLGFSESRSRAVTVIRLESQSRSSSFSVIK
jgi:hypothetical protein